MSVNEYAEKVVSNFIKDITDHLFLSIERDDDSMREYMTNVNQFGLSEVNMAIGLKIKESLNLENDSENPKPKSRLIKSYTYHKVGR
jgi:spore maturation protein SpmA